MGLHDWSMDWSKGRYSDHNLREMCREGIARVRDGEYDAVAFHVLNQRERDIVTAFMLTEAPDVKIAKITYFDFL